MVKPLVEVYHTKESLKSRVIHWQGKLTDGGGVLGERMETRTGEVVAKELSFRNCKLAFAQANRQAMDPAQLQDISERLNMGS